MTTTDPTDPGLATNSLTGLQYRHLVLPDEEIAKGLVRPIRKQYRHRTCGAITEMADPIAATFAADPTFYTGGMCVGCRGYYRMDQFTWVVHGTVTDIVVGT